MTVDAADAQGPHECRNVTNHDPNNSWDCGGCPRCPDDDEHRCHLTGELDACIQGADLDSLIAEARRTRRAALVALGHECDGRCLCFSWGCPCDVCVPITARVDQQITDDR